MLYLASTLTHLGAASVKLSITAQDGEGLSAVRPAEVTINVLRSAQAPAVFQRSRYTYTVPEDAPPGTSVGTVEAINPAGEFTTAHLIVFFTLVRELLGERWICENVTTVRCESSQIKNTKMIK